jgi:hypothetical protein
MESRKKVSRSRSLSDLLRAEVLPMRVPQRPITQDLFS